jgi:hypothetical protein
MPVTSSDLKFFQSELEGSVGGAMSLIEVPKDEMCLLFRDVTRDQASNGLVDYKKLFMVNTNPADDLFVTKMWMLMQPGDRIEMAVGLGTLTDADGSVISYSTPDSIENSIYLGDLGSGKVTPIWLRRAVPTGIPEFEKDFFQLAFAGKAEIGA